MTPRPDLKSMGVAGARTPGALSRDRRVLGRNRARFLGVAVCLSLVAVISLPAAAWCWGSAVHRLINRNAVANLPEGFKGFSQWADELATLATAADERKGSVPGESM